MVKSQSFFGKVFEKAIKMLVSGKRIKQRRKELDLSQQQLAELTGISQNSISRYERGEDITSKNLMALSNVLGVSTDWILGLSDENPPTYRYSFDDLDPDEIDLIKTLREAPTEERTILKRMIKAFQHEFIHSKS